MKFAALWLINPFIALILSLQQVHWRHLRNSLWFFTIWFAMTFAVGKDTIHSDQARYFMYTEEYHEKAWSLVDAVENFNFSEQGDLARHFLLWGVSRFTDNGYVFLIVIAAILGYFYASNVTFILSKLQKGHKSKIPWFILLLVVSLFFVAPIDNIGGVRFINATHFALYGLLPFLFNGNKKRLPFFFLSPLIFHFAMWIMVFVFIAVLLIWRIAKNFPRLVIWLFLITSLLSGFFEKQILDLSRSQSFLSGNAEFVEDKTSTYWSDQEIESRENVQLIGGSRNWYANLYTLGIRWTIILLLFFIGRELFSGVVKDHSVFEKPLIWILLFFILFNGLSGLPGVNRFDAILNFLGLAFLLVYWVNTRTLVIKNHLKWLWPAVVLFLVVALRSAIYNVSGMTFIGSPVIAVFTIGENEPVNEAIKNLFGL